MTKRDMVLDAVAAPLATLGFKRRKNGIFGLDLAEGVVGWLGLNRATKYYPAGEVEINPVVGVRHDKIEQLVAELRGAAARDYRHTATLSTPLGYLLPDARYRAWVFTAERADAVAGDMVASIAEHGIPFMRSIAPLAKTCRALEPRSKFAIEDVAVYGRPIAWMLAGDTSRAFEELDKSVRALGDRSDLAANDFRRFANALLSRLYES